MVTRRRTFQEHWARLYFRDYLIAHPQAARDYERLKIESAAAYPNDRLAYTNGKTAFIQRITAQAKKAYELAAGEGRGKRRHKALDKQGELRERAGDHRRLDAAFSSQPDRRVHAAEAPHRKELIVRRPASGPG